MPVSITATTTDLEPVVVFHASGASMSTSATPPDWPTLLRPQSVLKDGSLGRAVGEITKSGST